MKKTVHLKSFSMVGENIEVYLNARRLNKKLNRAQYALDSQVMTDMVPYMPHNTGMFVNETRARSAAIAGSGEVIAAAPPMGRFLYEGKLMVDPETYSPWASPGAKKVVVARPLTYSNPKATPHWFETAKKKNLDSWIKIVEQELKK